MEGAEGVVAWALLRLALEVAHLMPHKLTNPSKREVHNCGFICPLGNKLGRRYIVGVELLLKN